MITTVMMADNYLHINGIIIMSVLFIFTLTIIEWSVVVITFYDMSLLLRLLVTIGSDG